MNKNIEAAMGNIDSKLDRTRDAVDTVANRAEQGVLNAADEVARQTHDAGTVLHDSLQTASEGVQKGLNGSARAIGRGYDRARTGVSRAASSAKSFATGNPKTSLLILASASVALGMLAYRKRIWA